MFAVLFLVFSIWIPDTFLQSGTWRGLLDDSSITALIAVGLVIPLAAGGFNLAIGAEVGFSSAGAGALGSLLLLSFTRLTAAEVVGTDLCFGLGVSAVGSVIQLGQGNFDSALLYKLVIGGFEGREQGVSGALLAQVAGARPHPLRHVNRLE